MQFRHLAIGVGAILSLAALVLLVPWLHHQPLLCVVTHHCLPSYRNTTICASLAPGASETALEFQLGEPIRRSGTSLFFEPSPPEPQPIEVEFDADRKAIRYFCRGRP